MEGDAGFADLARILRVIEKSGKTSITFDQLDVIMKKAGRPQFHYDSFIQAYQTDPSIKKIVRNFNKDEIMFKDKESTATPDTGDSDTVNQMAKRATDLTDL